MQISILDIGGNFLGPALGLRLLGHEVLYCSPGLDPRRQRLAAESFRHVERPVFDAELFVYSASFRDEAWALEVGIQKDAPLSADDPLFSTIHPEQSLMREAWLAPRLGDAKRLAVVDMSDCSFLPSASFAQLDGDKFQREKSVVDDGVGARAFPFLYHPILLELEFRSSLEEVMLPIEERHLEPSLLFAGTLDHWRYKGRRRLLLHRFRERYPDLPVEIVENAISVGATWQRMQLVRGTIYLPGHGELCFRLHEAAAFGIPCVAVEELNVELLDDWPAILPTNPVHMLDPVGMLRFYRDHYHPRHAARYLLTSLGL